MSSNRKAKETEVTRMEKFFRAVDKYVAGQASRGDSSSVVEESSQLNSRVLNLENLLLSV